MVKCNGRSTGFLLISVMVIAIASGCHHDPEDARDSDDYFDDSPSWSEVSDPIEFTDEPYDEISGELTIGELRDIIPDQGWLSPEEEAELEPGEVPPNANVWYGFGPDDPYPVEGDCNPENAGFDTIPSAVQELPATIEGVVTLHPRYFSNLTVCGTRERYYGTYVLEDETGGIQIYKDSRVAEFDVGDRVRMRVRGVTRYFGTSAVIGFDQEEVLNEREDRIPVYYEPMEDDDGEARPLWSEEDAADDDDIDEADTYRVRRMVGEVVQEATNQNFNEMIVQSLDNPDVEWFVSIDRELGTRGVAPPEGAMVELTGPIFDSFEMRMVIASLGQMTILEEPDEEAQE